MPLVKKKLLETRLVVISHKDWLIYEQRLDTALYQLLSHLDIRLTPSQEKEENTALVIKNLCDSHNLILKMF